MATKFFNNYGEFEAKAVNIRTLPKGTRFMDIQGGIATKGDEHGAHHDVWKATGDDGHETCYAGCANVIPMAALASEVR